MNNRILLAVLITATCLGEGAGREARAADPARDRFDFATGLLIRKEYDLAAEEFETLLKEHADFPETDTVLARLAEACYSVSNYNRAIDVCRRLVTEFKDSDKTPRAHFRLGQMLSLRDDHAAAAASYGVIPARWPDDALAQAALYWSGEEHFRAGAWDQAAAAFEASLKRFPDGQYAPHARYSMAWTEFNRGRYAQAEQAARAFLEKFPDHELAAECRMKLADALRNQKRPAEARTLYGEVQQARPALAGDAALGVAWCLYEEKSFPLAAEAFAAAGKLLTDEERRAIAAFNAGNAWIEAGDMARAAAAFGETVERHGAHRLAPEARAWQAYALVRLGSFAEAEKVLASLDLTTLPADRQAEMQLVRAEAAFGLERHADAARVFGEFLAAHAGHPRADRAVYGRMLALDRAGDLAGAESAASTLLGDFGKSDLAPAALTARADYRFRQSRYEEARGDFEQLRQRGADAAAKADAAVKCGWCLMRLERPADARQAFAEAAAGQPQGPRAAEALYMAGRAAEDAGQAAEAAGHYGECLRLHPDSDFARRADAALMALDLAGGRVDEALARAQAFLGRQAGHALQPFVKLYEAEALNRLSRYDEAAAAYEAVAGDPVAVADAAYGLGWVRRRQGRHEDARVAFERVAAAGPKGAEAAFWACRSIEDAGRKKEAAERYESLLRDRTDAPQAEEARYRAALCLMEAGENDAAAARYRKLLDEQPKSAFAPNALYDLAWMAQGRGERDEAESLWRKLLEQHPQSPLRSDVQFRLGESAYGRGNYAAATAAYEACAAGAEDGLATKSLYKLGWSLAQSGRTNDAAAAFLRLGKDHADSEFAPEAGYRAGALLAGLGRHAEALAAFGAVRTGEFVEKARFEEAECHRLAEAWKEAIAAYGVVLKDFPESPVALRARLGRGHCYRGLGAWADALADYEAVVSATETLAAAQAALGIGHVEAARGRHAEAAKAFLKVDILYGYDELKPEALHGAAQSWEKAGDAARAQRYRDELKKRYPASEFVGGAEARKQ